MRDLQTSRPRPFLADAKEAGKSAHAKGDTLRDNPYAAGSQLFIQWYFGWKEAQKKMLSSVTPSLESKIAAPSELAKVCCTRLQEDLAEVRPQIESYMSEDPTKLSWSINGCCGGGCFVLKDIRFCPFCGAPLPTDMKEKTCEE